MDGKILAFWREEAGYSQSQAARFLKISRQYLWRLENNKRKPSYRTLVALARLYGRKVWELQGLDLDEKGED